MYVLVPWREASLRHARARPKLFWGIFECPKRRVTQHDALMYNAKSFHNLKTMTCAS